MTRRQGINYLLWQWPTLAALAIVFFVTYFEKRENAQAATVCNEKLIELTERQTQFMEDIREILKEQQYHGKKK